VRACVRVRARVCVVISEFKKVFQHRTNLIRNNNNNSDLLADSHNIFNSRKNCFCQLLNVER
jgi:hypothetical protein